MNALAAAIELGARGYVCFPCRADKSPACPHSFLDGSTDAGDLKVLWRKYPGPLVGVATGLASRIAVVDLDKKHPQAFQWFEQQKAKLLPTRMHQTRSGGLHLLYGSDDDGVKCSAGKLCKGVDVRGNGGFIIWWPAAGCQVLADGPMAPWPDWLRPPLPTAVRPPRRSKGGGAPIPRAFGLLRAMANAAPGQRNQVLHWCGCRVREMVEAGELAGEHEAEVLENLHDAALRAGLAEPEITRTLRSAMRAAA